MADAAPPKPTASTAPRPSVLSLNINSKSALYAAYMPLLRNGGIFIPTTRNYAMGDEVFMLLSLMDDPAKLPISRYGRLDHPGWRAEQQGAGHWCAFQE
jgi:type IV pilus assembly protein PilZ